MIQVLSNNCRKEIALILSLIFYGNLFAGGISYSSIPKSTYNQKISPYAKNIIIKSEFEKVKKVSAIEQKKHMEKPLVEKVFNSGNQEDGTGPSQPEMQTFSPVGSSNMVDLFTGDFSYNIPLMDVGGYPINIAYRGGVTMDQEASWVGLGWNVNPGTITRNLRGLPDDFNGTSDTIKKTAAIKENRTIGVTAAYDQEILGKPGTGSPKGSDSSTRANLGSFGASLGIFNNNYKGWGLEIGLNASLNAGAKGAGPLSGGLSITNNSQDGLTINPSLSVKMSLNNSDDRQGFGTESFSISSPYNSRGGIKALQMSVGVRQGKMDEKNQKPTHLWSSQYASSISFATPSFTPTISLPYTSSQFSFTGKVGLEQVTVHPNLSVSGYVSKQKINKEDQVNLLPSYGYLNFQNGINDSRSLLDFNREKEIAYREKPAVPHIAVPSYTYDLFSITGEGTGGMFRAYRSDIGYVYDHYMKTKDASERFSIDIGGVPNLFHPGVDLNLNRSYTQSGPWNEENVVGKTVAFKKSDKFFEAAYFRNPGEKTVNSKAFYNAIGGDDVVAVELSQPTASSSSIIASNTLLHYNNKKQVSKSILTAQNSIKGERDKRSQVISYLTAEEAGVAGLSKYIESYNLNTFSLKNCSDPYDENNYGDGTGLKATYFNNRDLAGSPAFTRVDSKIDFNWGKNSPNVPGIGKDFFSIRWTGRLKAQTTGGYIFKTQTDDGVRLWLNDRLLIDDWNTHSSTIRTSPQLNLIAGEFYNIKLEFFDRKKDASIKLIWNIQNSGDVVIPTKFLYNVPLKDVFVEQNLTREKRVNIFRKPNHISQINVLNADGRKYVYGIPVYNLVQKEATFSIDKSKGDAQAGLANFEPTVDNSLNNTQGRDHYFSSEEIPAYAHTFLLSGILSPDYVDLSGDGISDDDIGDAVKFNYTRTAGITNSYQWRSPYVEQSLGQSLATYNEGLKTDNRDDRASYTYGKKEIWYLNAIESKNMVAVFFLDNRLDGVEMDENGFKTASTKIKRLEKISLYNKTEFLVSGINATPIKVAHFDYDYQLCKGFNAPVNNSGKLTLKKIWFTYNGNSKGQQNPYIFNYHSNNPDYTIKSYDRWGNFKDPSQNPSTNGVISNADYPYSNQDSTQGASNVAAWTLNDIQLPSGGKIKIDYESDDYAYVQNRRAMQMFKIAGFGSSKTAFPSNNLYSVLNGGLFNDNLYVFVNVPLGVTSQTDLIKKYLDGVQKIYFKLSVQVPSDEWGSGYEYIPCYADVDNFGYNSSTSIWIKLKGINLDGTEGGSYSPLAKAATQFLKLNLSSKAYPGSEVGDNVSVVDAVKILLTQVDNMVNTLVSYDKTARLKGWMKRVDLNRSLIRLTCPGFNKKGGGSRVKRIRIYDNWNAMTSQKESVYGQEYEYTATKEINGVKKSISSGVASYEPGIGGEENPFHLPIEYIEKVSVLAPVTMGYTEEPLGESFFPSPSVGYSRIKVRSLNTTKTRSANGFDETKFYTAFDFPTLVDRSVIDADTKKRFKPALANFLRINSRHYVTVSQGFKIELNDMHGKLRSQASYAETDFENPVSYSENFYQVEDQSAETKKLSSSVLSMASDGTIDANSLIGKDAELMLDMREQQTVVNGNNFNVNAEIFTGPGLPPFFILPTLLNLFQREETRFRSVAATKVIQRFGILDSVVAIDKGSKVSTKNLLYDGETGDVLLTRTQNEFNDPIYNFSYPAHWAYDNMGMAYKNIDIVLKGIYIKNGKITTGLPTGTSTETFFASGDELLIYSKPKTSSTSNPCVDDIATFPVSSKIWAIDVNSANGGTKDFYFIDKTGKPFTGNDITLKIIRSGRKNMGGSVGSITSLVNPLSYSGGIYSIAIGTASKIVNASAAVYKQVWKTADKKNSAKETNCILDDQQVCSCSVLNSLFTYLKNSHQLFIKRSDNITVGKILNWAGISPGSCSFLSNNSDKLFYALTTDSVSWQYSAQVGDCVMTLNTINGNPTDIYSLEYRGCSPSDPGKVLYKKPNTGCFYGEVHIPKGAKGLICSWSDCNNPNSLDYNHSFELANSSETDQSIFICYQSAQVNFPNSVTVINSTGDCDTTGDAELSIAYCRTCTDVNAGVCYSAITETVVNPYNYGIWGNFRVNKAYTYYASRADSNALSVTNIRKDGAFASFAPFWSFQSGKLISQPDTTKWVWNSEITMFNQKGAELENKDPLDRYNSGIYGYNYTLPVAVVQNSQYREAGFEGFEDYDYSANTCDNLCPTARHFDFSSLKSYISQAEKHSGKYSLKIEANSGQGIGAIVSTNGFAEPAFSFAYQPSCGLTQLQSINTNATSLIPVFNPVVGKKYIVSAWVKESRDCKCESYTNSKISVALTGSAIAPYQFKPSGNIIEGWQRIEGVIIIPAGTTSIQINFQATGDAAAYFDDIRVHPFNANMKSFVYNPINLRLMAELDENNYATFYEYDDDGTLVRVKKETEKGVKTIKETRSALYKDN